MDLILPFRTKTVNLLCTPNFIHLKVVLSLQEQAQYFGPQISKVLSIHL